MFSMQGQQAFGMFDGRPHDDVTAVGSRHRATYQNDFLRFALLHNLKILHCHPPITHVTWHSLIFPNAAGRRAIAYCADAPMRLRSVRRALPREVVLFHYALETLAFRATNHIHEIARLELRNAQVDLALREILLQTKFAHDSLWLDSSFLEFTDQRFAHARFLLHAEPDLHRRITFVLISQTAQQNVIARRDHGHRTQSALRVVNAGHTNFLSKKSDAHDGAIADLSEAPPVKF